MSLLEQDTSKKERVDKSITEFDVVNTEEYEVEAIWNNVVYVNKLS